MEGPHPIFKVFLTPAGHRAALGSLLNTDTDSIMATLLRMVHLRDHHLLGMVCLQALLRPGMGLHLHLGIVPHLDLHLGMVPHLEDLHLGMVPHLEHLHPVMVPHTEDLLLGTEPRPDHLILGMALLQGHLPPVMVLLLGLHQFRGDIPVSNTTNSIRNRRADILANKHTPTATTDRINLHHRGNAYHPHGPPPRPPTQVQNYGPHFEGANHKDAQPFFQYSQCTGKKKALCIGINYFGQTGELRGCINDARNIQNFLCTKFNYKKDDIVMLTDDATNPRMMPTRENILNAMNWLVRGAQPNDSLFFHYSGHGGQTKDTDGDEGDGYDEVIYPMDYEAKGHIVDDVMHDLMVKPLPAGCRLTAIFDSCHSGSAMDLPYIYSTEGKVKEPNLAAEAGQGLLSAVTSYARGDMGGVFKSAMGLVKTAAGGSQKADKIAKATRTSPADVISWSGCKDSQTSADTQEAGNATGAMSFAFMSSLGTNAQQSYQELLGSIRDILKAKYSQKPQLSSSHPMDTNIMFIC
ncbi:caspase domain-containing protein [Crassisporium funariophilum]|nr:caspase domain-containing protein [Crassisporium funariophilum]